jgi:hypothetical protein
MGSWKQNGLKMVASCVIREERLEVYVVVQNTSYVTNLVSKTWQINFKFWLDLREHWREALPAEKINHHLLGCPRILPEEQSPN